MTREEFAERIRWPFIIWTMGFVNVLAMVVQLIALIQVKSTAGLSLGMLFMFFVLQIAFSLEGFFKRSTVLMVCMGLSAAVTASIIGYTLYLRSKGLWYVRFCSSLVRGKDSDSRNSYANLRNSDGCASSTATDLENSYRPEIGFALELDSNSTTSLCS